MGKTIGPGAMEALLLTALGLVATLDGEVPAQASTTVALRYHRGQGAQGCPDKGALMQSVSQRLGYHPWREHAPQTLVVQLDKTPWGLEGRLHMEDAQGRIVGSRVLRSRNADCQELTSAMALAMSIAIDPLAGLPSPSLPVAQAAPSTAPPPLKPSRRVKKPRAWWWPQGYFGNAHVVMGLASAPEPAVGLSVGAGLRWPRCSLALEARRDLPAYKDVQGSPMGVGLMTASGVACFHSGPLRACGLQSAGVLTLVERGDLHLRSRVAPYVSVGSRLGVEVPLTRVLKLDGSVEGVEVLTRVRVKRAHMGTIDWEAPPAALALRVGVLGELP